MALPQKIPDEDDDIDTKELQPDYITRAEFESRMKAVQTALTQHIDEALKDMRQMLGASLEANKQQREMISSTLDTIQTSIKETIAARDSQIKELVGDVNTLQAANTQLQVAVTELTSKMATLTETVTAFVKKADERDATSVKRFAQLETRIEENWTWIDQRRKLEARLKAMARPATQLPRWAKFAVLASALASGTQWQLDWAHWIMELFQ